MDKLRMMSMDNVQMNVEKIQKLFPNAVTEVLRDGKPTLAIDFDVLKQELSAELIDDKEERYQMTWPDKKKSILLANTPISATLRPCKEESVDFDHTQNLYIEGDNLDVLKLLQETYLGKVKMIYIDPPYNTGNDFVYNDDFRVESEEWSEMSGDYDEQGNRLVQNTESNGRFHTDWLNMIYPRLKVAKDLLSDDGVIFISIDDNEQANLKKMCDEIFGSNSFVTTLHVEMSATQGMKVKAAQNGNIVKNAEYVLVYSKDGHKDIAQKPLYDHRPDYDNHYTKYLDDNDCVIDLTEAYYRESGRKVKNAVSGYAEDSTFRNFVESHLGNIFRYDKTTGFDAKDFELNKIYKIEKNGRRYVLQRKETSIEQLMFLKDSYGDCDDFNKSYDLRKIRGDWWKDFYKDMGNVSKEGDMIYANGKKPVRLIKQLCSMVTKDNNIVLDFFSGSCTTAHAIMQLNTEDEGSRRFIMIQLPSHIDYNDKDNVKNYQKYDFKTICDIGKERIRRAGKKIKEENPSATNLDIGFRVLKLDSSNMKDVYYKPEDYSQGFLESLEDNIKADRTPLDLLFQVMLDLGKPLSAKIEEREIAGKRVFVVDDNDLVACFDSNVTEDVVKTIAQLKPLYAVFRDSGLSSDSVGANFDQIFATYSPNTTRKVL